MFKVSCLKRFMCTALLFFTIASMPVFSQTTVNEADIVLNAQNPVESPTIGDDTPSLLFVLLRIVLALALVSGGIYGIVYLMKKTTKVNVADDPYLRRVALLPLSQNKSVQVVTLGKEAFVIGVAEQGITLLSKVEDGELVDAMNLAADRERAMPRVSFASLLQSFLPKGAAAQNGEPIEKSAESAAGRIRERRENLMRNRGGEQ